MSKAIAPDYGQQFLLPPSLEDWVGPDDPVRFLREFVDQLDLAALGFVIPAASEGRPPYAPSLMLKIWLYGYMNRIRSTRQLEAACRVQLPLLWLTGMLQPDHNSLWRFWRGNKKAMRAVFKRSAQLALEAGLVGLVWQAVDGTKIAAAASGYSGWNKERLEKLLAQLDAELEQAEREIEKEGEPGPAGGYRLPAELADKQALREKIRAGLEQMEQMDREHLHPGDPEARRGKCEGTNRFGYNAQAVVDAKAGIITAAQVVNQENDTGLLVPMVEEGQQNCGPSQATVADSSYGTGADIAKAAAKQLNVLVRPHGQAVAERRRYHAHNFRYEPEGRRVICPEGQELKFARRMAQKGQMVEVFACHVRDCPVRHLCTKDQRARRTVEIWPHTVAVQQMREGLKEAKAAAQLAQRGEIVERVFGHIKQQEGFRRWTVRGLEGVNTQWALLCCAINLRTLYRCWRKGRRRTLPPIVRQPPVAHFCSERLKAAATQPFDRHAARRYECP
jgi:transposase